MKKYILLFVFFIILLSSSLYAVEKGLEKDKELWNFDSADIETVVKRVSEETGKNFVLDPRVQGKVTIISQHALNPKEVYEVFLSVLRILGFKAIDADNVIKIIPQEGANNDNGSVTNKISRNNDEQIIKVISLKYVSATEMLAMVREMIPRTSHMFALTATNSIIIADTQSNILKIEKIVQQIDTNVSQTVEVISLHHASASDVVTTLTNLLRDKGGSKTSPIAFAPDDRTNSILVSGGSKELRRYTASVIRKLDSKSNNNANSEVIYLQYVQARDIAPIVAAYLEEALRTSDEAKTQKEGKETAASAIATASSAPPTIGFNPNHLRALQENSITGGAQGTLFADNEKQAQSGIVNRFVQWEQSTNAIIVKAPPTIMRALKSVIAKLDIKRPQVLIEVIIAEVNLDRVEEFGVEWNASPDASVKFATRFFPQTGIIGSLNGALPSSLALGGMTVGVFRHGDLRAIAKLLSTNASANLLSTPTLVTLDNQTALIKVGEKVPFAIGQTNNQDTNGNPFTSYDREEVGLSLTIKPQIVNNGEIRLQIENILSNVIPDSANIGTGGNPRTSERTVVTNVLVQDGKILVLGGLIQDAWQEVKSQVPFLGSVPGVGELFKRTNKQLVKKNLMIFLRPTIICDDIKGVRLSTSKYDQTRLAELESYDVLHHPFIDEPVTAPVLAEEDYYPREAPLNPMNQIEVVLPPPFQN